MQISGEELDLQQIVAARALLSEKRGRKEQLQVTEQLIAVSILDNSLFDRSGLPNAAARTRMPAPNSHIYCYSMKEEI